MQAAAEVLAGADFAAFFLVAASAVAAKANSDTDTARAATAVTEASNNAEGVTLEGATVRAKAAADAKALSPASVKRYLTVARLVAPIAAPVVYRAAVAGREQLSTLQANRAGVSPEVLRQFSGHGATLSARIATTRTALEKVVAQDTSSDSTDFVAAMTKRLDNLDVAVQTAETMSAGQRRTAHKSIADELEAVDADILARLGVRS